MTQVLASLAVAGCIAAVAVYTLSHLFAAAVVTIP